MKLTRLFPGSSEGFWLSRDGAWEISRDLSRRDGWRILPFDRHPWYQTLQEFLETVGLDEQTTTFRTRKAAITALEQALAGASAELLSRAADLSPE